MLVQVQWTNKMYDYVPDYLLDELIESGNVLRFLRSSGWAVIGVDPIRSKTPAAQYVGVERRGAWQPDPEHDEAELELIRFLHCSSGY